MRCQPLADATLLLLALQAIGIAVFLTIGIAVLQAIGVADVLNKKRCVVDALTPGWFAFATVSCMVRIQFLLPLNGTCFNVPFEMWLWRRLYHLRLCAKFT